MRIVITGANGFIGKNLRLQLAERKDVQVVCFTTSDDAAQLPVLVREVDFVFHLAGVNRAQNPQDFATNNVGLTVDLCHALICLADATGKRIPVIYASSAQACSDNLYGQSKREAEKVLLAAKRSHQIPVHIFRLPNIFGKWGRPNYNSVVATFCHNIARGLPIEVHDPDVSVTLVYVDDLIQRFLQIMDGGDPGEGADGYCAVGPQYTVTVGELAREVQAFKESRTTLMTERVGSGLLRAMYATYVSYLPVQSFAYPVPQYNDPRGVFVEMLKTPDCGQFSFFTAYPGVTRGGHYHHSKTEKFLVIKGQARFRFRQIESGQTHELVTQGDKAEIVETVPGWTHDVTNIGPDEMVVMLWANEVFDRERPDTFACPVAE